MRIEPSKRLEVVPLEVPGCDEAAAFLDAAIFGFLDIVLVAQYYPWRNIRIVVLDLLVDPINSSCTGFCHAGRDAGGKFLAEVRTETIFF